MMVERKRTCRGLSPWLDAKLSRAVLGVRVVSLLILGLSFSSFPASGICGIVKDTSEGRGEAPDAGAGKLKASEPRATRAGAGAGAGAGACDGVVSCGGRVRSISEGLRVPLPGAFLAPWKTSCTARPGSVCRRAARRAATMASMLMPRSTAMVRRELGRDGLDRTAEAGAQALGSRPPLKLRCSEGLFAAARAPCWLKV
mmetsp:Transcript_11876/g.28091  ORF Transcript_11876/g.28091 Transcript_11876/m.28091 type:complete len:200 (-) Transcript_11876:154-753(-)